ncbi:MAG TPA: DUF2071 domain-containing protein [Puia sp.]|nr:DUF2071 domain-containing protein [Puia sp.]
MQSIFLTAEWRKLIMANYPVDPAVLKPFLPAHTELDYWRGETYVSLVGFMFRKVRVKGVAIPFHRSFPEVNLRFYVRYKEGDAWKRGVVFISEIVPRRAITWVANTLFREHYVNLPMRNFVHTEEELLQVGYQWKYKGRWNNLEVETGARPLPLQAGSNEEFITEHFWGYAAIDKNRTGEYQVEHPRWDIHKVLNYQLDCDFESLYGGQFAELGAHTPESVFLAEGSPVKIYSKKIIS